MLFRKFLFFISLFEYSLIAYAQDMCRQRPIDVVFLLDGSRSVRSKNFQVIKDYVKNFTNIFQNIGPSDAQVGIVQFGSVVREEIRLDEHMDRLNLFGAIDNIDYMETGTMTGEALKYLVTQALSASHGARIDNPLVHKVAVIITDGKSQDYHRGTVTKWQRKAKEAGVELYAIGIGRKTKDAELLEIASEPKIKHKFHTRNFEGIQQVQLSLDHLELCDDNECEDDDKNDCEQICVNTEGSYTCECRDGFTLQEDGRSCISNDPCILAPCSHRCFDLGEGRYECRCPSDMILDESQINCQDIPPPVLDNLRFGNITHTGVRVFWVVETLNVDLIENYSLVYVRSDGKGEPVSTKVFGGRNTNVLLLNLEPETKYDVSVTAFTANDKSDSLEGSFTTLSLGETLLTLDNPTLSSLTASWTAAGGHGLTGYEVTYQEVLEDEGGVEPPTTAMTRRCGPNTHEMVLTGLKPSTRYFVRVVPLYGNLSGETGTGQKETAQIETPEVTVLKTTLSRIAVSWNPVNHEADTWEVEIFTPSTGEMRTVQVQGDELQTVFENLQPNTQYDLAVTGNISLDGHYYATPKGKASGRTRSLAQPQVEVTSATESSITVKWTELDLKADSWLVKIYPKGGKKFFKLLEVSGNKTEIESHGLKPSTMYKVEVVGRVTEDGHTFKSPAGDARGRTRTLPEPPVQITDTGYTSLSAQWEGMSMKVDMWMVKLYQDGQPEPVQSYELDGHETSMDFAELKQGLRYSVEVVGRINADDISFDSPPGNAAGTTNILSPPDVECTGTSVTTATVQWSNIDANVNSWTVKVYSDSQRDYTQIHEVASEQRDIVLRQLNPSAAYRVEVIANVIDDNTTCTSPPGETDFMTDSLGRPSVNITSTGIGRLTVQWGDINVEGDSWTVTIADDENPDANQTKTVAGNEHSTEFVEVEPGKRYLVEVIGHINVEGVDITSTPGFNEGGFDSPPGTATVLTTSLIAPDLECTRINVTTAVVEWSPINVEVTSWTVRIFLEGDDEPVQELTNNHPEVTLTGLQPGTTYRVEVIGNVVDADVIHNSPPGDISFTTRVLTKPSVEIIDTDLGRLTTAWDHKNVKFDTWTISLYLGESTEALQTTNVEGDKFTKEFTGLTPGTRYKVEVVGHMIVGDDDLTAPFGDATGVTNSLSAPEVHCDNESTSTTASCQWTNINATVSSWFVVVYPERGEEYFKTYTVDGSQRFVSLDKLLPSTSYIVEVVGNVFEGYPVFQSPKGEGTFVTSPLPPRNVRVLSRGLTDLIVGFDPSLSLVDNYDGQCISADGVISKGAFTSDLVMQCSGLIPATEYNISVVSIYRKRQSETISTINTTLIPPPSGLTLLDATTHTLLAEWQSSEYGQVDYYVVACNSSYGDDTTWIVNGNETAKLLTGLQPGTEYTVKIKSLIGEERSHHDVAGESTLPDIVELRVDNIGYRTVNLSWNLSLVPHVVAYILTFSKSGQDRENEIVLTPTTTTYIVTGLTTATEYRFSLYVRYSHSTSSPYVITATTLGLSPLGPLTFSDVTESSFDVHWVPPESELQPDSYVVTYSCQGMTTITIEGLEDSHTVIQELNPNTTCNVSVSARYFKSSDDEIAGDWVTSDSITGTGKTEEYEPEPPTCSCENYLQTQSRMQVIMVDMLQKIEVLTSKIDQLTSSNIRLQRSSRKARRRSSGRGDHVRRRQ
ncbi:unnamed protein product [Clavelina lepadiformis]|uniref:Uncharacterized protein n=1 Tax=Clavelina lepadiformis TaxID=159417 RepID=A0ABP0GH51_CLALP